MQWEDADEGEEEWEAAEAEPVTASGAAGRFDVEAAEEAGWLLLLTQHVS